MQIDSLTIRFEEFNNDVMRHDRSAEVSRILREMSARLDRGQERLNDLDGLHLQDRYGNTVGKIVICWSSED